MLECTIIPVSSDSALVETMKSSSCKKLVQLIIGADSGYL